MASTQYSDGHAPADDSGTGGADGGGGAAEGRE